MNTRRIIADRFEISDLEGDLLGRGGMGDVYRAKDAQTGETVAVKVLKPHIVASNPDLVARFVREGETLRQLDHPNIVQMVAAVEEDGQHYLVMEYVEGGSLRDLLEATRLDRLRTQASDENLSGLLPIERVIGIALELADALSRAHHLGVIHRDLKPANVLLAEDGTPRLTDFGLAHVADSPRLTQPGILMGSVGYISPEACNGETLDNRADIWALGVMLYEMLVGKLPFARETLPATLAAILTQPVPHLASLRPDLPDALVDLVYRTLEKDRHQRIPSARLVGAELEAILRLETLAPGAKRSGAGDPGPRSEAEWGRRLGMRDRFATPTPTTMAPKHNLPLQPTSFVGRKAELGELAQLLAEPDVRLVTVLGAGGMGKTRLALQAAQAQLDNYAHGVFFVPLAPLRSVEAIVPTVAEALGFSFYADVEPQQQLLDYLRQKNTLVLMDNFEHLLDGVELVSEILKTAPDVKILATSRARLNVRGEHRFHLAGMDFPDWETPEGALEYSAVKLFMQSARRARPGFVLQADDLKYVARMCRLVRGMPLGIQLAAAWVEMLSPQEIAAEISQDLDFLETDLHDVPARHRSMRAVFDHSWRLLTQRKRQVFQGLSVFRGSFTREAVQEVTDASLRELMELVNKSLLLRRPTGRYEVHELSRQYAAEMLAGSPDARETAHDRHSAYYAAALQGWAAELKGPHQQTALAEMDAEIENARAAWDWAVKQGAVERLEQAMDGLCLFYTRRGRFREGRARCRLAAGKLKQATLDGRIDPGYGQRIRAKALAWQGVFNQELGRAEMAGQLLRQSLALLEGPKLAGEDTRSEKAAILLHLGELTSESDREQARKLYAQSLALCRALGDRWETARVLNALGWLAWGVGDYGEAKQSCEESLALRQALGDQWGVADSLQMSSRIALALGQYEQGERLAREGIAILREIGDRASVADGLNNLGITISALGRFAEARPLLEESAAICDDLGFRVGLVNANVFLSVAEGHLGNYEPARSRAQACLDLAREIDYFWGIGYSLYLLGAAALVKEQHEEARQLSRESVAVFREMGQQEELSFALVNLGLAAQGQGRLGRAGQHLYAAMRTASEIGAFSPLVWALAATAPLLADQGQEERAVEIQTLAWRYPSTANSRWLQDTFGQRLAAVAAALPPDVVAAAQERGRARDLQATVAELLVELGE